MKHIITALLVVFLLMPLAVRAGCVKYEYAEIKDMDKKELEAAIKINRDENLEALKWGNKFLENGSRRDYERQNMISNECEEQAEKLNQALKKR